LFERPKTGENAILVHIHFSHGDINEDIAEFQELAVSAGANIVGLITSSRESPDAKYFVGLGKANEIRQAIISSKADLILFNHALTPAQERNLEQLFQCRVLDRTGLILDIFAQRAQTFEGKLQVELAQLQHLATRLVRGWTHLERQKGGIGLRGPGETQLESDRRLIKNRIKTINKRLHKVKLQRDQGRRSRKKALIPIVSIVGYTNVGKSTLFNKLTGADVFVANQPFATLDPTLRLINLAGAGKVIIADTVGFIRHLPHDLIEAFSATLEETHDASLLLHIIDIADESRASHIEQVNQVLEQIGADKVPQLLVYNKIDALEECEPGVEFDMHNKPKLVRIAAAKNLGLEALKKAIADLVYGDPVYRTIILAPDQGKLRALLYDMEAVISERCDENGYWVISIKMAKADFMRLFPGELETESSIPL
jgi:GTP-binding protein HflX